VHGTDVLELDGPVAAGTEADGAVTRVRGLALVAMGADCAPVALGSDDGCGVFHAGWRGLAGGVVGAAVAALREVGTGPVRAAVGPCICAPCYEFGAEALADVAAKVGDAVVARTAAGSPALDLRAGILAELGRAGVHDVEVVDVCTFESPDHFSFRRDGVTGRHGAVVGLVR
jgi:YfiH family protein